MKYFLIIFVVSEASVFLLTKISHVNLPCRWLQALTRCFIFRNLILFRTIFEEIRCDCLRMCIFCSIFGRRLLFYVCANPPSGDLSGAALEVPSEALLHPESTFAKCGKYSCTLVVYQKISSAYTLRLTYTLACELTHIEQQVKRNN